LVKSSSHTFVKRNQREMMKLLLCIAAFVSEGLSFSLHQQTPRSSRPPVRLAVSAVDTGTNAEALMTLRAALVKMQTIQDPAFFDGSDAYLKEFHNKITKLVTVQDSSIPGAGKGLFAAKDLLAGTIVGFYPTHCIGVATEQSSPYVTLDPVNQEYFDNDQDSNYMQFIVGSRPLLGTDVAQAFQGNPIFVDANPNLPINPGWVGHLVNDGAIVSENTEAGLLKYYKDSNLVNNCVNIPFGPSPIVATVTTQDIEKGGELFTSYGCLYWLQVLLGPDDEPTSITPAVIEESKETAKLLLSTMLQASRTYEEQVAELQVAFENI
jgi:hypothetical protein